MNKRYKKIDEWLKNSFEPNILKVDFAKEKIMYVYKRYEGSGDQVKMREHTVPLIDLSKDKNLKKVIKNMNENNKEWFINQFSHKIFETSWKNIHK